MITDNMFKKILEKQKLKEEEDNLALVRDPALAAEGAQRILLQDMQALKESCGVQPKVPPPRRPPPAQMKAVMKKLTRLNNDYLEKKGQRCKTADGAGKKVRMKRVIGNPPTI